MDKTEQMSRESAAIAKLQALVDDHGGPAAFARTWRRNPNQSPINASYVSQILNGHSSFGEKARMKMAVRCNLDPQYFEQGHSPAADARLSVEEPRKDPYSELDDSPTVLQILRIIRQLPARAHLEILGAVRVIAAAYGVRPPATTTTMNDSDDTAASTTPLAAGT